MFSCEFCGKFKKTFFIELFQAGSHYELLLAQNKTKKRTKNTQK